MRLAAIAICLFFCGCPSRGRDVVRDDWVVAPAAAGQPREVLRRDVFVAQLRSGERKDTGGSLSKRPPPLLDAGETIALGAGEVKTFALEDEPIARMTISGSSAEVFWGRPFELHRREDGKMVVHQAAEVHVQAVGTGESRLTIELKTGQIRTIALKVAEGGTS